jgi:hypothetical protein
MPDTVTQEAFQWIKYVITASVAIVVNAIGISLTAGKYITRLESNEKDIKSLKAKVSPENGIPIMMSVPECIKTQAACQALTRSYHKSLLEEMTRLVSSLSVLDNKTDKRYEDILNMIDKRDQRLEKHIETIYDKINELKSNK